MSSLLFKIWEVDQLEGNAGIMDIFVAGQPIFHINNNIIAYELLFRNGHENTYDNLDGNQATLNVIANNFMN